MQVHLQKCVNMLLNIALLRWKHKEEIFGGKEQADFLSNTLTIVQELLTHNKLLIFLNFYFLSQNKSHFAYVQTSTKMPKKSKEDRIFENKTKPNLASYIIRRQLHTRN